MTYELITRLKGLEQRRKVKELLQAHDNIIAAMLDAPDLNISDEEKARFIENRDFLAVLNATAAADWSDYENGRAANE